MLVSTNWLLCGKVHRSLHALCRHLFPCLFSSFSILLPLFFNVGTATTLTCQCTISFGPQVPCAGEQLLLHQHYSSSGSEDDGRDDEEEEGGGPPVQVRQPIAVVAVAEFVRTPYSRPRSAWGSRLEQSESEIESALEDNNWLRHEMDEKKVVVEDLKDAAFSLDETLLVVAGPDHRVCVYDVASGESVHEFDACKGTVVNCVAISPSSKIIFTGGQDGILKAWDATAPNLTLLRKLRHPKAVKSCATNQALPPRGYSAIYREGGAEGRVAESAAESDGNVAGAEAEAGVGDGSGGNNGSFDGARRAQTDNGSINSHNTIMDGGENEEDEEKETETEKEKEKDGSGSGGHGGGDDVDDGMVATGCADGRIRIWNCGGDWVLMHTIVHGCSVQSLAFSSNGAKVVSGGFDWRVKVWDWATDAANAHDGSIAAVPTQLCAHRGSISALAFSNKGDIVASGSRDTTCRLW